MQTNKRYLTTLIALFFSGWLLMYANRTVLTPVMTILESSWQLNRTQLGLLNSLFFLLYAAAQVPSGLLADRFGRKLVLVPGYLLHSVGAILSGLAPGFYFFLAMRMTTGLSQGTYFSTQYAISSAEIPPRYRAASSAVMMSGSALGIAIGTAVASYLVFNVGFSWRIPFLIFGLLAFALSILMQRFVRQHSETKEPGSLGGAPPFRPSVTLVKLFLVGTLTMYGFYVIITWLPYYLQTARQVEGGLAGLISTVMPLATIPSALVVGLLADRTGNGRSLMTILVPVAALGLAAVALSPTMMGLYLGLAVYGLCGKLVIDPLLIAMVAEQTPRESYGRSFAYLNFAGTFSMVLAPTITGLIVDLTGSFPSAFLLAAMMQLAAWILLLTMKDPRGSSLAKNALSER